MQLIIYQHRRHGQEYVQLAITSLQLNCHSECFTAMCKVKKETFQPMASLSIFMYLTCMKIVGQIWNYFAINVVLNNLHLQLGDKEFNIIKQLPSYG